MINKIKENSTLYQEILVAVKDLYLNSKDEEDFEEISNPLMEGF